MIAFFFEKLGEKKPRQGSRRSSVSRAYFSSGIGPLERRGADLARGLGFIKFREGGEPKTPSPRAMANRLAKWWRGAGVGRYCSSGVLSIASSLVRTRCHREKAIPLTFKKMTPSQHLPNRQQTQI